MNVLSLTISFFFCCLWLFVVFSWSFLSSFRLLSFLLLFFRLLFYLLVILLHLLLIHLHLLLLHHLLLFLCGVLKVWITSHLACGISTKFTTRTCKSFITIWHFLYLSLVFLVMDPVSIESLFL